jgi:hypothetical protein
MTNLAALDQGSRGSDCRGEEHIVELVWSVKSGKTRVYWNKRNISHLFRDGNRSGMVEFAWNQSSGETLQIVAHSEARPGVIQYDLFVNGTSFFKLPSVKQLGFQQSRESRNETEASLPEFRKRLESMSNMSALSDLHSGDQLDDGSPDGLGFRLSMAGLNTSGVEDEIVDELHSALYSPTLESLRHQITECLPQTEEMVSKAIINAFFCDSDSQQSFDSLSDAGMELDPYQTEANAVWEAYEWVGLNVEYAPRPDAEELALSFMQKQIDDIFLHIRNDKLSSDAASRILLSVGAVLGLKFANSISTDTIILDGLNCDTTAEDLHRILCSYGQLECTAVVKSQGFALCRFFDHDATIRVLEDAHKDCLVVAGATPSVIALSEDSHEGLPQQVRSRFEENEEDDETSSSTHVIVGTPAAIPHLMAPLSTDACCFEDLTDSTQITPDHSSHQTIVQASAHSSCCSTSSITSDIVTPDMVTKILTERIDSGTVLYSHALYPNNFES